MIPAREHNEMVDFILSLRNDMVKIAKDKEEASSFVFDRIRERYPNSQAGDLVKAVTDAADRHNEERLVYKARHEAKGEMYENLLELCVGLPDDVTIGDAVRLRAKQGHPFAIWVLKNPHVLNEVLEIPEDDQP